MKSMFAKCSYIRSLLVVILMFSCFNSVGQFSFSIGGYFRYGIEPQERYYKALKMGFDQEFYTPLVLKLKGKIVSCTIQEIIPDEEAKRAQKYEHWKSEYEAYNKMKKKDKKRMKKQGFIPPFVPLKNGGYNTYNFVYRMNDHKQLYAMTLNEVILYDYNETALRNGVSFYALTWKDSSPEALYFQGALHKERNSKICLVTFFDHSKAPGRTQDLIYDGPVKIDTTEKAYLKISDPKRLTPSDTNRNNYELKVIRKINKDSTSSESGFYVLSNNDTLFNYKQFYNERHLIVKRIIYNRELYSKKPNNILEKEEFDYDYDHDGNPVALAYTLGKNEPVKFKLKFVRPDEYGNYRRLQVFDQNNVLLREVGWYMNYSE